MKTFLKVSILAVATLVFSSCGGDKVEKEEPLVYEGQTAEPQIGEQPAEDAPVDNNLTIECNDQMQFTKSELLATTGTITLTLKHVGKMEKTVMGHNLVILKPGTDIPDFSIKSADAKATEFIPASEKANVIAHTRLLGGGESDTIEFEIAEKGTYDYICSFPGHSTIMKGKLIVE